MSERTGLRVSQVTDEVLYTGLVQMQELDEAASFQIRLYASWLQQQLEMFGRDWGEAEVEAYSVFLPSGDRHGGQIC